MYIPYGMEDLEQQVKRMQDVAKDELFEKQQIAYNKLYPNIEHKPKAVQLSFNLNRKR